MTTYICYCGHETYWHVIIANTILDDACLIPDCACIGYFVNINNEINISSSKAA